MKRMCTIIIFLVVFLVLFSIALAFSGTIYTCLYFYLIPQINQSQLLYFNYAPVEQSQKQRLDKEQQFGLGIATYMGLMPNHKLFANAEFLSSGFAHQQKTIKDKDLVQTNTILTEYGQN